MGLKINDCHLHLGWSEEINRGLSVTGLQQLKEENNIENTLVFASYNKDQKIIDDTQNIISELNNIDKGIKGLAWLDSNKTLTVQDVDNLFSSGFVGFKYHGTYTNKPITDPIFQNILRYLDMKRGILLVHCGMYLNGAFESNTSFFHPLLVSNTFRNIKVILAHAGGSMLHIIKHCCEYAKSVDNVWLETSGITSPVSVEYMVKTIGANKILFGSDVPWCSFKGQLFNVLDANISDSDKNSILYDNLNGVLE